MENIFLNSSKKLDKTPYVPNSFEHYESNLWSYMIQDQNGQTLEQIVDERNQPLSPKTTIQIGIQLLEQYKFIHAAGYCHNDLKLENILVGNAPSLPLVMQQLDRLSLIDFGLCTKYRDSQGQHVPK
jgi:serine/threonine protein kinase